MGKNFRLYRVKLTLLLLFSVHCFGGFTQENQKIKGLSFVGASSPIDAQDVHPITEMNANWVTLMPYGFVGRDGKVIYNSKWQWWGEKTEGVKKTIELCKERNLKIMLKPQIWMMDAYTGDYKLSDEKEWETFEDSYEQFILTFLNIAISYEIELFCIGTEWREFVAARPVFWNELIHKAEKMYNGQLTYAANWDDYQAVPFWDKMDYIGVNGYFPISISKNPSLNELIKGWEVQKIELALFSEKHTRGILFTEIGYRSMVGATLKPWEHGTRNAYSEEIQDKAYQALFSVLWKEPWFKGMFIWKWYHNHKKQGGQGDLDFTPQNKSAAETIRNFWSMP